MEQSSRKALHVIEDMAPPSRPTQRTSSVKTGMTAGGRTWTDHRFKNRGHATRRAELYSTPWPRREPTSTSAWFGLSGVSTGRSTGVVLVSRAFGIGTDGRELTDVSNAGCS